MRSNPFQSFLWVVPLSVLIISGISSPLPDPEASPSPQYQYLPPSRSSQSSQQFTMYKPIQIQLGYPSPGTNSAGGRTDANGNPLHPIFTYNYNISHPPKTPLQSARNQFFNQQQQNPSQQGSPLAQQYQRQFQRNQNYAPVIIANPNFNQPNLQSQNLISGSGNYGSAQFYGNSEREREPEDDDISFRTRNRNGRLKAFDDNTRNKIVFDQRLPNERFLNQVQQYPDNIVFSNGQNQLSNPANRQSFGYNFGPSTTPPPIQVPYITTPSALKTIQQLSQNKQQAFAGYRTKLGLVNPQSLSQFGRTPYVPSSTPIRTGRVQNIVVPISNTAQTPAGTRLLQQNLNGLQNIQNSVAQTVFNHQQGGSIFPNSFDLSSPNLHILKGLAITPENQRAAGHLIFNDPYDPTISVANNAVLAGSAQKVFILPQGDSLSSTDSENTVNSEDPSEIIITVVDESVDGDEKGKVLSNFSLLLLPSTYKKCVSGTRRAHDGKCRLIIKLRGRARSQSGL